MSYTPSRRRRSAPPHPVVKTVGAVAIGVIAALALGAFFFTISSFFWGWIIMLVVGAAWPAWGWGFWTALLPWGFVAALVSSVLTTRVNR